MTEIKEYEKRFLRKAMQLAEKSVENGNHPFGAVLARGEDILFEVENSVIVDQDVTSHPEFLAAQMANQRFSPEELEDCTLYASTEPCPMCSGAIYWAGIGRIIFACSKSGLAKYAGKGFGINIYDVFENSTNPPEIIGPVLESEAEIIHKTFWKFQGEK